MTYNINTGIKRVKRRLLVSLTGLVALTFPAVIALSSGGAAALTGGYTLFGDVQIVSPGYNSPHAIQARSSSTVSPGYGGVDYGVPSGMTVSQLNNLSTEYQMVQGLCGGGSPRFSIGVTNGTDSGNIFVYLGTPPSYNACSITWTNTGNLVQSTSLVDTSQLSGGTFYEPYGAAQTAYGSYTITSIDFVVDGSWFSDPQAIQIDNTQVNNTTYTYDQPTNKDECKDGGWQNLTDSNGNHFKNQGDCVSYAATGGKNQAAGN